MNSVSEGLYEGVPLLMIPQAADQIFIAQRIQQLGAGKMLRNAKVNAQSLRKAAEEILMRQNPAKTLLRSPPRVMSLSTTGTPSLRPRHLGQAASLFKG
jgi:UDP:flavonoid glycosyltransferase YjiC (YdhE family)